MRIRSKFNVRSGDILRGSRQEETNVIVSDANGKKSVAWNSGNDREISYGDFRQTLSERCIASKENRIRKIFD